MDGVDAFPNQDTRPGYTEMSLHVLAYNLKRVIKILGSVALIKAIRACMNLCCPLAVRI